MQPGLRGAAREVLPVVLVGRGGPVLVGPDHQPHVLLERLPRDVVPLVRNRLVLWSCISVGPEPRGPATVIELDAPTIVQLSELDHRERQPVTAVLGFEVARRAEPNDPLRHRLMLARSLASPDPHLRPPAVHCVGWASGGVRTGCVAGSLFGGSVTSRPLPVEANVVEVCAGAGGGLVLRADGELCHFGIGPLVRAFDAAKDVGEVDVEVDLGDVALISAAAVEFFLRAAGECEQSGGRFRLTGATGLNRTVLLTLGAAHLHEEKVPTRLLAAGSN